MYTTATAGGGCSSGSRVSGDLGGMARWREGEEVRRGGREREAELHWT